VPAFGVGFGLRLLQRLTGPQDRWLLAVASIGLVLADVEWDGRRTDCCVVKSTA